MIDQIVKKIYEEEEKYVPIKEGSDVVTDGFAGS